MYGEVGVDLVRRGWPVIPINGREPRVRWKSLCTRAPAEIQARRWARDFPEDSVALVLGSGLAALDSDATDPCRSIGISEAAEEILGRSPFQRVGDWPRNVTLYRAARGVQTTSATDVELKARGQLITICGQRPDGTSYRTVRGDLMKLRPADLPRISPSAVDGFFDAITPGGASEERRLGTQRRGAPTGMTYPEAILGVALGRRHLALMKIAYACRGRGVSQAEASQRARQAAARCAPPVAAREADDAVDWVYRHLPPGRPTAYTPKPGVPALIHVAFERTGGAARLGSASLQTVVVDLARDAQEYLGHSIALPQMALATLLGCTQGRVSQVLAAAVAAGKLVIDRDNYRPGRVAKRYLVPSIS